MSDLFDFYSSRLFAGFKDKINDNFKDVYDQLSNVTDETKIAREQHEDLWNMLLCTICAMGNGDSCQFKYPDAETAKTNLFNASKVLGVPFDCNTITVVGRKLIFGTTQLPSFIYKA